ncbi:MAG: serine/threonine protein kinase [Lachnospiraceae bacterium]
MFGVVKGEGGFGLTYIGKELGSGKLVAIKEYFPSRCQPQRQPDGSIHPQERFEEIYMHGIESFLSEASMLRAVSQLPSIVHVMDYFEAGRTAYMVMEYLNGSALHQVMQTVERMESNTLLPRFLPLMRDLGSLHDAGVLHRDIAPDNIMLMSDGSLKLLDFGCARSLEDGRSMTVVLKPGFAPIEQYQTRGQGPYTDLYALCATIYYCITGKIPPASPERLTSTFDGQPDPLTAPSALGAAISPEQEQILMWGLALQPSVRPQSMEILASRLEKTFAAEKGEVHESGMQCITVQNRTIQGSKAQNSIMENSMMQSHTVQNPAVQDRMTNEAKTNIQVKRLLPVIAAAAGVLIVLVIAILCLL